VVEILAEDMEEHMVLGGIREGFDVPNLPAWPCREPACALSFAYGVITSGIGPSAGTEMVNGLGMEAPPHNQIYAAMKSVCDVVKEMARESCEEARTKLLEGATISFDGSLEHRRNAQRCLLTICHQQTKRVID
jgi:hypothetical protein